VNRIFLTLALAGNLLVAAALLLGLQIDDPAARSPAVQALVSWHLLTGLAALCFTILVHALVLTYFMGTGRWLEETTRAYGLPADLQRQSWTLKYRVVPLLSVAILLLILVGATGAAADPASHVGWGRIAGMAAADVHLATALGTWAINVAIQAAEYSALLRNGAIVQEVLQEVRRIRMEHGLPV